MLMNNDGTEINNEKEAIVVILLCFTSCFHVG